MATLALNDAVFFCTNCQVEKTDPVTLACYHSVCQQCLTKSRTFHKDEDNFCPVCDTNAKYSDSADSLRSKLGACIDSASRTLEDLLVKSGLMYCSVCCLHSQRNKVTHQCLDCADFLCDECHTGHQSSSATYSHRVVAIEDVNTGKYVVEAKKNIPCGETNHRGRTYTYFCQSCVIPICELCFLFQHRGHEVLTIDDAVQICSKTLVERSQQLSKCITDSTSTLERFRNLHQDISSIREATVKCIRNKTKKAVDLILEQEQAAVTKLSKACDRQLKLTSTLSSDLKKISSLCPKLLSLTNLVLGPGQDTSVLVLHNDLEKCFNESKLLQDATDVFASKLKTPVFVVRCDIPQSSVISITHSFQNSVVGAGDSKKDESMPHDKSASSVLSTNVVSAAKVDDGVTRKQVEEMRDKSASSVLSTNVVSAAKVDDGISRKQAEGMRDKSVSSVLSTNVLNAATADDGATRKQDEGMKDISLSNSFTSETVIAKANPYLSDTESECLPGEIVSGIPFAVVAPRFKFEQSISGFVVTDVLRSNENLFPQPSAVDGSSSGGRNICRLGDSSCFKLTASLMIVAEAGKALLVRCASARYPFEGPEISFCDMNSVHKDSTKVETGVTSAIRQGVTSDALMTEPMTSRDLKGDASDSLFPSCPVAREKSGLKGLDSTTPGASVRTFDDEQKDSGNEDSTDVILSEPQNTESPDMIVSEPQNTESPDVILSEPQNTVSPDMILSEHQNIESPDMILSKPQNTESPDMIVSQPQNIEPPDMILSEPQNTESPDMIQTEPQNTETQDMTLGEPLNTETPDMILAEPQNTEIQNMILSEPLDTKTPAEPWKTEPSNITSSEPLTTGHPEMIPSEARKWETPDMISAVSVTSETLELVPARPQHQNIRGRIPAALRHRRAVELIPSEPQNSKTPESSPKGNQSNCCIS
ncbi:uncharacterized protein [Haliotis asinina]|uniref:uncharacterized protein n=1 Tax=Haliotis asinina TaxID=109174 RepID=UPI003531D615